MILNKIKSKLLAFLLMFLIFFLYSCTENNNNYNTYNKHDYLYKNGTKVEKIEIINKEKNIKCKIDKLTKIIKGNSMYPELKNGETVNLLYDYYKKCLFTPKKGDIIAYDFAGNKSLLIKKILVDSNDNIVVNNNKLIINRKILSNSKQKEYVFKSSDIKMLKLYIKDGHIPKGTYFIFGDNTTNSIDSRKFGAISIKNISGKFDL